MRAVSPLLCVLTAALIAATGCGGRSLHWDDPPLLSNERGNTVVLSFDADGFDKLERAHAAGRNAEFVEMLNGGRFFPVSNGTGITVLESGTAVSKVRIRKDGREAYVQTRYIRPR